MHFFKSPDTEFDVVIGGQTLRLRVLSSAVSFEARTRAGVLPFRGVKVQELIISGALDHETLTPEDLEALDDATRWTHAVHRETLRDALVSIDGEPWTVDEAEAGIRPASACVEVFAELYGHVVKASSLDPTELSNYGQPCGSTSTTMAAPEHGVATSV